MLYKVDPLGEILLNYMKEGIVILCIDKKFKINSLENNIINSVLNNDENYSLSTYQNYLVTKENITSHFHREDYFNIENKIIKSVTIDYLKDLIGLPVVYLSEFIEKHITIP